MDAITDACDALAERHDERIAAVVAVEARAIGAQHAHVVHEDGVALGGRRTFSDGHVGDHEFGRNRLRQSDLGFFGVEDGVVDESDLTDGVVG